MKPEHYLLVLPDGFELRSDLKRQEYIVLFRYQHSVREGIGTAYFDGIGWYDCSEPGQPIILQYLSPVSGRFENWK